MLCHVIVILYMFLEYIVNMLSMPFYTKNRIKKKSHIVEDYDHLFENIKYHD